MDGKRLGKYGEYLAQDYLRRQGYEILHTNFRRPYGEIDIIARHNGYLVFVEVKTRSSLQYGRPSESVNRKKRRTYINLAQDFMYNYGFDNCQVRFDVIEIIISDGEKQYNLITNAF
ncbi:MAG TPA: YraN family protein [Clostridiales bacterium]|nr:YraN family protein [Clostridiales bacterium]